MAGNVERASRVVSCIPGKVATTIPKLQRSRAANVILKAKVRNAMNVNYTLSEKDFGLASSTVLNTLFADLAQGL
jgi:hypothetical protein